LSGAYRDIIIDVFLSEESLRLMAKTATTRRPEVRVVDQEWDVILVGAGQNSFALGTYLGMAGLTTVICESRLENGGRLASEEITMPGYWHNTLA
jgi:ribulose 1,5-bisphosphate synthetase/thiazole synthase